MGAELLSAVYPLCYLGTAEELLERALPRWWGRAIQALFLSQVRELDAGLAAELHEPGQARYPYIGLRVTVFIRSASVNHKGLWLALYISV